MILRVPFGGQWLGFLIGRLATKADNRPRSSMRETSRLDFAANLRFCFAARLITLSRCSGARFCRRSNCAHSRSASANGSNPVQRQNFSSPILCCASGPSRWQVEHSGTAHRSSGFSAIPVERLPRARHDILMCAACEGAGAMQTQHRLRRTKARKAEHSTRGERWRSSVIIAASKGLLHAAGPSECRDVASPRRSSLDPAHQP